jgi:proteasome activator-like protein
MNAEGASRPDPMTTSTTGPEAGGVYGADGDGRELVQPEVMEGAGDEAEGDGEQVTRPTKLIRIASMVRTMLDEVRRAPLDDAGRRRLREIHEMSVKELEDILSPDLRDELQKVVLPFTSDTPTESELRLAQAQLVGWLEGLFHGIQATLFTQQAMAQGQLEEMRRRRALESGAGAGMPGAAPSGYL